jgi:hypothetical protein
MTKVRGVCLGSVLAVALVAVLAVASCVRKGNHPRVGAGALGEIQTVRCGNVTAHFTGVAPTGQTPPELGVEALWFDLGDGNRHPFRPGGTLHFSDWSFEVFSPDCGHVLLLQDRYGPYHAVRTATLEGYLAGRLPPAEVFELRADHAVVHCGAHWVSEKAVELRACGETTWTERRAMGD